MSLPQSPPASDNEDLRYLLADIQLNSEPGVNGSLGGNMESEYFDKMLDQVNAYILAEIMEMIKAAPGHHSLTKDEMVVAAQARFGGEDK